MFRVIANLPLQSGIDTPGIMNRSCRTGVIERLMNEKRRLVIPLDDPFRCRAFQRVAAVGENKAIPIACCFRFVPDLGSPFPLFPPDRIKRNVDFD